jgi:hypothetical protein
MNRHTNSGIIRFSVIVLVVMLLVSAAYAAKVQVPEGTEVKIKFPSSIKISSGELGTGVPLLFSLAEPISVGGKVIIEKGAEGTAVVKESVKNGRGGKPGKIVVEFVDLATKGAFKTLDDSRIKLVGEVSAEGKGKKLLSYLFIFGLFIKGGQGELSNKDVYTAQVAESVILEEQ